MENIKIIVVSFAFTILGFGIAMLPPVKDATNPPQIVYQKSECVPKVITETVEVQKECNPIIKEINVCKRKKHSKSFADVVEESPTPSNPSQPQLSSSSNSSTVEKQDNNIIFLTGDYGYSGNISFTQSGPAEYAIPGKNMTVGIQYSRRLVDQAWGFIGVNLRGNGTIGLGCSFK
jgi:hypothetical protein